MCSQFKFLSGSAVNFNARAQNEKYQQNLFALERLFEEVEF